MLCCREAGLPLCKGWVAAAHGLRSDKPCQLCRISTQPAQALPAILKWGLAEDKDGALTAVPLPKALQRLDDVFDNIFSFSVWQTLRF